MDVARLNFSHGTHAEHAEVHPAASARVRRAGAGPIAILQDLQGPKIRLGHLRRGRRAPRRPRARPRLRALPPSRAWARSSAPTVASRIRSTALKPGDQVLDGRRHDPAHRRGGRRADEVRCRVIAGGRISDHKGLSLPRVPLPISCLTDKDREDLRFGIQHGVDFVAVSFVRSAADIARGAKVPAASTAPTSRSWPSSSAQEVVANLPGILDARGRGDGGARRPRRGRAAGGRAASSRRRSSGRRARPRCR